jgi:hypothetical protein
VSKKKKKKKKKKQKKKKKRKKCSVITARLTGEKVSVSKHRVSYVALKG